MTKYEITRWDGQKTSQNWDSFCLSFYFKPDLDLLKIIKDNNNIIQVEIDETDTIYDKKKFVVVIDRVDSKPNGRPNFDIVTHEYLATMPIEFIFFPPKKGNFTLAMGPYENYKKHANNEKEDIKKHVKENFTNNLVSVEKFTETSGEDKKKENHNYVLVLLFIILVIIIITLILNN